jgi:SAM-dependent methyltransferase
MPRGAKKNSVGAPVPRGTIGRRGRRHSAGTPQAEAENVAPGESSNLVYSRRRLKAVAARWDAKAADWDQNLRDPDCHLNEDQAYARFVACLRKVIRSRKAFCSRNGIIDAGCGTGLVLDEIASSFAWGLGIDISPEMIAAAKKKSIKRARFKLVDCFRLHRVRPKAGAVVSRGVLLSHYGPAHAGALLRAARAALRRGGFIVFDFLNARGRRRSTHQAENKTWFTAGQIRALAGRAGFRQVQVLGEAQRRVRLLVAES